MEFFIGVGVLLFILFIINSNLSIEKELKELNKTNKKIAELLADFKKDLDR